MKSKINYRSLRFRLTALFVTLFGTTLIIFSSVLYSALVRTYRHDFDVDLYNHTVDIASSIKVDLFGDVAIDRDILSNGGKIMPFAAGSSFVQVITPDGKVLAQSQNLRSGKLPLFSNDSALLLQQGASIRHLGLTDIFSSQSGQPGAEQIRRGIAKRTGNASYRMISYLVSNRPLGVGFSLGAFIVQVAVPMTLVEQSERGLRNFLFLGIPITLVLAALASLYISGRALQPVNHIIEKAKQLSPNNLSERIPVPEVDDELKRLSLTLNELLDRLQGAFESQERFIADASHELKTPLAILRGELDLMKSRPRTQDETRAFLESASQELDHLARVVEDLLLLARVDAGAASLSLEPVRADEIALEAFSRLEPLAKKRNLRLQFQLKQEPGRFEDHSIENPYEVIADGDLLRVMMKNLIENAIKFSPESGAVEIELASQAEAIVFRVRDEGPGIPTESREKIFERFFRVRGNTDDTRSQISGAGLGLAIAHRIMDSHQGALRLEPSEKGAVFAAHLRRGIKSF